MVISSMDSTQVVAIASGFARAGAAMEINSADLKPDEALAASNGELLKSVVRPADPMGSMGAPIAILINERRFSAVVFDMVFMVFLIRLMLNGQYTNEALVS